MIRVESCSYYVVSLQLVCVCVCVGVCYYHILSLGTQHLRRIEDKLDSRRLGSMLIAVRMEAPPQSKRVSMNMWGWLVWQEDSWNDNIFKECELATLRFGG